jgi:soluble lytic murein transglycosylase-like protein
MKSRRRWLAAIASLVALSVAGLGVWLYLREHAAQRERYVPPKPEAPPDLAKLRPAYTEGFDALQHKDAAAAIRQLGSFTFGGRAVEEYRLFYLARAFELAKNTTARRLVLAQLWAHDPKLAARDDAGNALAALYADAGDWTNAAAVYQTLAAQTAAPEVSSAARLGLVQASFAAGDAATLLDTARLLAIRNPAQHEAGPGIAIVRALTAVPAQASIHLTAAERLERAVSLMRDNVPTDALDDLNALDASGVPADLKEAVQLNRGLCLSQIHQYEASNKLLEPLASSTYKVAVPALLYASRNYRALAASINPIVIKTVVEKKKVGNVKTPAKGSKSKKKKVVAKPKYANVKKNVQLVDLAKKAKKDEYERLGTERLKDLLTLPLADDVRLDVLNQLVALAEAKNQDPYERELVPQIVKLDPGQDPGLQHLWDKAWAAYAGGDLKGAREQLKFLFDTYASTNVRRQARYWYARAGERLGLKDEARETYDGLAKASYEDVYVLFAAAHGAKEQVPSGNPLKEKRPDWNEIAEKGMPPELRLAYELTALSDARDARAEIRKNANRGNHLFADALQADLYNSEGNMLLMMRSLRHAWPQLGSVDQDSVPPYFLRMYHPTRYEDSIRKSAKANDLDPYLIMGLIHQESYYNPRARSAPGAVGLMQLMPATGKELARRLHSSSDLENPDVNIRLGTFYFRQLVNLFGGNTQLAVASYNAGQGNVAKWRRAAPNKLMDELLESIPFPETRTYVKRVTVLQSSYRRLAE